MAHRGPDDCGEWLEPGLYLGHRRLAIVAPGAAGRQPMADAEGVLSFNGELYNFIELRRELVRLGHSFTGPSDTEVMLHAFRQWDTAAVSRFDGMFAGGWHDRRRRRHLLFRDPLGQKPLYYHQRRDGVVYASELRGLLELDLDWRLDRPAFARYLANGYYGPCETPVAGIRKLPPGCTLDIDADGARLARYWTSVPGEDQNDLSEGEALDALESLLAASCERTMRCDKPVGVFLSGGIDSTLILDFCARRAPEVQAFSLSVGEADFDEAAKAASVARHLGVHRHHTVRLNERPALAALEQVLAHADEPHGDPGTVNAHVLAWHARQHVSVALTGDGGDELFAGYLPFLGLPAARLLRRLPDMALSAARLAARTLPVGDGYLGPRLAADHYLQAFPAPDELRLPLWLAALPPEALARLLPGLPRPFFSRCGHPDTLLGPYAELQRRVAAGSDVQRCLHFFQQVFLPEYVCLHTDRTAMQHGLEVRSPLLSPDIIAFANRLPDQFKARGLRLKWLLRRLTARRGFPAAISGQRKQGFALPMARWLKGPFQPLAEELLFDAGWAQDGLVDAGRVAGYYRRHRDGQGNHYRILYNLMAFRAWRQTFPGVRGG